MSTIMKKQTFRIFLLCLLSLVIWDIDTPAQGTAADAPSSRSRTFAEPPPSPEEGYLINFPNVNIIEYIKFISQITNKNFIFKEDDLKFSVTILSEEPTSIENIIAALVQILRIHGLSLLEQGNNLIIHKNAGIAQVPKVVLDPNGETGIVTKVFQLRNVSPATLTKIIAKMVSADSLVEISPETRHLIVTDIASNVEQIEKLLQAIDTPNISLDIGAYTATNTRLEALETLTQRIITPLADTNPLVLVPHQATNTIYIVSTPYLINRTVQVMRTLDVRSEIDEEELPVGHIDNTNFYIYKLQFHKGEDLIQSLQEIGSGLNNSGTANEGLVSTIRSAQWLQATNSLLFSGDSQSLYKVKELAENLDAPLRQVFIEMLVLDTTVSNSLSFGVDWALSQRKGNSSFTLGGLTTRAATGHPLAAAVTAAAAAIPDSTSVGASSDGLSLGIIGNRIKQGTTTYTSLGALVKALQKDGTTNILLNPKIITQDTSPAEIFVGGTSAFQASQSVNSEGSIVTVNVEYKEVGARLKVTPILGPNDIVTLEIEQEISEDLNTGTTSSSTGSTDTVKIGPVTTKSFTKTRVHVPDQNFLIISGMIRENKTHSKSKIPCLGSLPVVGDSLFGTTDNTVDKRNLMIFLRPHIVTSPEEAEALTHRQKVLFDEKTPKGHFLHYIDELDEFDLRDNY